MPIVTEITQSETLVIAATGFRHRLDMPLDEFFNASGLADASRIVLSDPARRMTLGGIPPQQGTFAALVTHLRSEVTAMTPRRLITVGTSGGGYTAMLLGHLLKAQHAVAFAPYPYLTITEVTRMGDPVLRSMGRVLQRLDRLPAGVKKFLDLKEVLAKWNGRTHYHVHVSRNSVWDLRRAAWLEGLPHLSVTRHPYGTHAVALMLARAGKLRECFEFARGNAKYRGSIPI